MDRAEFGEDQSLRERYGVGLGMDSEVKTKFHVLKVLACDELRPYYKIEGKEIHVLYIPRGTAYSENCSLCGEFLGRDLSYGEQALLAGTGEGTGSAVRFPLPGIVFSE